MSEEKSAPKAHQKWTNIAVMVVGFAAGLATLFSRLPLAVEGVHWLAGTVPWVPVLGVVAVAGAAAAAVFIGAAWLSIFRRHDFAWWADRAAFYSMPALVVAVSVVHAIPLHGSQQRTGLLALTGAVVALAMAAEKVLARARRAIDGDRLAAGALGPLDRDVVEILLRRSRKRHHRRSW